MPAAARICFALLIPPGGIRCRMPEAALHLTHPDIVNRLKRSEGHLRTIIAMLEMTKNKLIALRVADHEDDFIIYKVTETPA